MRKATFILAGLCAASLGLAGCDVDKTQEGNVSLPNYDVSKTQEGQVKLPEYEVTKKQEGDITLPKYDVDAPQVDVSSTQKEVTVPKIVTEKETITVPKVDISRGDDDDKTRAQR